MASDAPSPPAAADMSTSNLIEALQVLQHQNRRNRYLLDLSYQWHLQHHANLKNIILGLNKFAEALQERGVHGMQPFVIHENSSLFQPFNEGKGPVDKNQYKTLHEFVLACGSNTAELQSALMQMTAEQFHTLQESSAEIALSVVLQWLQGADRSLLTIAAVFLLETVRKFSAIFAQPRNATIVRQCLAGLQRFPNDNSEALTVEELEELRLFLMNIIEAK